MGVAGGSPRDLQPSFRASRWLAVERAQETGLVGRSREEMDGQGRSRFHGDKTPELRSAARELKVTPRLRVTNLTSCTPTVSAGFGFRLD